MKVTQEKLPNSRISLEIEVPAEKSKQAYEQVIRDLSRHATVPGFRKGKVPRHILIQRFGVMQIKASALENLLDSSIKQAIEQEQIKSLGNVQLLTEIEDLVERFKPGEPLTFAASVDVPPDVELADYTGWTLQVEQFTYDPQQVEDVLSDYRRRIATLVPADNRPAQLEDVAVVDYTCFFRNEETGELEPLPGGETKDFQMDLVEGRFLDDLVTGIIGMTPGEEKDVPVQFGQEFGQTELSGKDCIFKVNLKELKERELPALDDEFAKEVSNFETLAELRESLEQRFQTEADNKTKDSRNQALLKKLEEQVVVELPDALVQQEVNVLINRSANRLAEQGYNVKQIFTKETIEKLRDDFRGQAIARLKQTMGLAEVAKRESITVPSETIDQEIQQLLETVPNRKDVDINRLRSVVTDDLLQDAVLDWLGEHCTTEFVPPGSLNPSDEVEESEDETTPISSVAAIADAEPGEVTVDVAAESATED